VAELDRIAAAIRLVVFDVDGVFTDGRLFLDSNGVETHKIFHVRDGYGVKRLLAAGIEVAIISGRDSAAVAARMAALGIRHVVQGRDDKLPVLEELLTRLGIAAEHSAFVGDDEPDIPPMDAVGLAIAVADAHPRVREASQWITQAPGGRGAVREVAEFLLAARSPD
jgi:3-deoxy-D-manno-octulosonate 8-phosphate phosphatase (KDO 8-P phosphatase)